MTDIDPASLTEEQLAALLREAGRRSAAKRKRTDKTCEQCGAPMRDVIATRKYCSGACNVRAHYWRERANNDPAVAHRLRLQQKGWLPAAKRDAAD